MRHPRRAVGVLLLILLGAISVAAQQGVWFQKPSGGGGDSGPGTGTANTLPLWATTSTLGDSNLLAESTDVYALRRGTNAQQFNVYATYTDASNFTRLIHQFDGSSGRLMVQHAGTGPQRPLYVGTYGSGALQFRTADVNRWILSGSSGYLYPASANAYDFGQSANPIRTGYFGTSLDVAQGTRTTDAPAWTSTSTWNASGVTFTHLKANITDTASSASSLLIDLQVGGSSKFSVGKAGQVLLPDGTAAAPSLAVGESTSGWYRSGAGVVNLTVSGSRRLVFASTLLGMASDEQFGWYSSGFGSFDTILVRDAADVLAQRRTTNAQTQRWYGTWTDASNYVRASLGSSATLVTLAAETAGTGADDVSINLDPAGTGTLQIDGTDGVSQTCSTAVATITVVKGLVTAITCP